MISKRGTRDHEAQEKYLWISLNQDLRISTIVGVRKFLLLRFTIILDLVRHYILVKCTNLPALNKLPACHPAYKTNCRLWCHYVELHNMQNLPLLQGKGEVIIVVT